MEGTDYLINILIKYKNANKDLIDGLLLIAKEANREANHIGASARRGDQSKADTFRFIRDKAIEMASMANKVNQGHKP